MLRVLYIYLLCLHPPFFRRRFAEEMLWIFDQGTGTRRAAGLIADAVLSLTRQWMLRPEFLERALAQDRGGSASDGVPSFYTFQSSGPRAAALVNGGVLSVLVFGAVFLGMAYGWGHPALSELLPGGKSPRGGRMAAARGPARAAVDRTGPRMPEARNPGELKRETAFQSAMGLLGLYPPARLSATAPAQPPPSPAAREMPQPPPGAAPAPHSPAPNLPLTVGEATTRVPIQPGAGAGAARQTGHSALIPFSPLLAYVGVYVLDPPDGRAIHVTLENGQLNARIGGEKKRVLLHQSGTKFVPAGLAGRWLEFVVGPDGDVTSICLFETGRKLARRR